MAILTRPRERPAGDFKISYGEEESVFQTAFIRYCMALLIMGLFCAPMVFGSFLIYNINTIFIAIIGALGLNIITGVTGLISLGQGAFMGVGAYTTAVLATKYNAPIWVCIPASGIVTAIVGGVFGLPSLRVKRFYLAIATLAAQFTLEFIFFNWVSLTGGVVGIDVAAPVILGYSMLESKNFYYLLLLITIFATFFARNLLRSDIGRCFVAIRDRDIAAEIIGVNLYKYKLLAFLVSSFYAGVAGSLFAYNMRVVSPEGFGLIVSIDYLAMIIVGGLGHTLGPIFGAILITLLMPSLEYIFNLSMDYVAISQNFFPALREIVFGLIIIGCMIFEPEGLAKVWYNFKTYWKLWPFSY